MGLYAFGAAGDIDIANVQPTKELIQTFVREVERREKESLQTERRQTLRLK